MTSSSSSSIADVLEGRARWCVVTGDALAILPGMSPTVHVITDGPYGVGSSSQTSDDAPYVAALRLLTESKTISFFGYAEKLVEWIVALGWGPPTEWVTWYPSNAEAKAGAQSIHRLPKLTEHCAIYGKLSGVRELRRDRSKGGKVLSGRAGLLEKRRFSPKVELRDTAQLGDIWTDPSPGIGFLSAKRLHPNEKPVSLMDKLVRLVSAPGDVVLDPFCGSGTTGVAALRVGRRFVGIELDPTFAAIARERLAAEAEGSTLDAARAGQVPMFGGGR